MLSTKILSMVTGLSTTTLVKYSKQRELKPYVEHIGRSIRFKESVVDFLKTYKPERKKRKQEEKQRAARKGDSICWGCVKSANECMWLRFHIPVEGWKATMVKNSNNMTEPSYKVHECPNYRNRKGKKHNEKK